MVPVADHPVEVDAAVVVGDPGFLRRQRGLAGVRLVLERRRGGWLGVCFGSVAQGLLFVLVGFRVPGVSVGGVVSGLEVGKDSGKGRDTNTRPNDDGMAEVIEALSWCTKRTVDPDPNLGFATFASKFSKPSSPVAIGLDVKPHLLSHANGHCEGMPLKVPKLRHLQKDILSSLVFPKALARDGRLDLDGLAVQHSQSGWDAMKSNSDPGDSLNEDQQGRKREPVAKHWPLQECSSPMRHHQADDRKHEQMPELEHLVVPLPDHRHAQQRQEIEQAESHDACPAGQRPHVSYIWPWDGIWTQESRHLVLVALPAAPVEAPSQMANRVQRGQRQCDAGHFDVEALTQVPVDEPADVVPLAHEGREVPRHAQDHKEEGRVQRAGTRLREDDPPPKRGLILWCGCVLDALPHAKGDLERDDKA